MLVPSVIPYPCKDVIGSVGDFRVSIVAGDRYYSACNWQVQIEGGKPTKDEYGISFLHLNSGDARTLAVLLQEAEFRIHQQDERNRRR